MTSLLIWMLFNGLKKSLIIFLSISSVIYLCGKYFIATCGINDWRMVLYAQLEMEDGDEIDAMLHQTGGGMTL